MIDVSQVRTQIDATRSEIIAVPKVQLVEMLAEIEIGQHARRSICNLRTFINLAATTSGAAA